MLQKFIYTRKKKKALKQRIPLKTIGYNEAKTIGVLFDSEEEAKKYAPYINSAGFDNKEVTIIVRSESKEPPSNLHFTLNQCKWYGKIESEAVTRFINKPFDFLILLNSSPHYITSYILAASKAACKVGLYAPENKDYFELMFPVDKSTTPEKLFKILQQYLKNIR